MENGKTTAFDLIFFVRKMCSLFGYILPYFPILFYFSRKPLNIKTNHPISHTSSFTNKYAEFNEVISHVGISLNMCITRYFTCIWMSLNSYSKELTIQYSKHRLIKPCSQSNGSHLVSSFIRAARFGLQKPNDL